MNRRTRRRVRIGAHSASDTSIKKIRTVLICAVCLILLIVLTVIWGNSLKNRADQADGMTSGSTDSGYITSAAPGGSHVVPTTKYDVSKVPSVKSKYVTLSSSAGINWSDRASALMKENTTAVSLVLYYGDNIVNFSSATAQALSYQTAGGGGKTNLNEACSLLSVAGIRTDGCFYQSHTSKSTDAVKNVFRAYEAALVSEALDAGFSDITVFGFDPTASGAEDAQNFISEIRELNQHGLIGVAIPASVIDAADRDLIFASYASVCDYMTLDLSSITSSASLTAALSRAANLIKNYNLRIMVSNSFVGVESLLIEAGCANWQVIPD